MKDLFSLRDKTAVITGGMGQLGQEYSCALAQYGARVAVFDISDAPGIEIPEFGRLFRDERVRLFRADITKKNDVSRALSQVEGVWDTPHILVNNAAIDSPPDAPLSENGPFESYPRESLDKVIEVNLKGTFICCQVIGGAMAEKGRGSIINISSTYGVLSPNQDIYEYKRAEGQQWYKPAAYSVTKAGVLNLTRYLATYWAKKGVRVNTLTPGGVFNNQEKAFLDEYQKRIPMGRMARSDEMNGAIVFLASEASSYMTGANVIVDGGWTAW